MRLLPFLLLVAVPASAQTPAPGSGPATGTASFTAYQRGVRIGTVQTWVSRVEGSWHVQSTSRVAGTLNVTFKQLELRYDAMWRGRFMTMEVERPRDKTIDAVTDEQVRTRSGTIAAKRYTVLEIRSQPTTVEVWVAGGRLLRLDVPRDGLFVVREDVLFVSQR